QAAAAVQRFGDRALGGAEVAARMLLRAEGLASSEIEGLRAPAVEVALAEAASAGHEADDHVSGWVADNLAAISDALETPAPLTVEVLLGWHRRLMRHATRVEPRHVGAWRDTLGWVGGPNPRMAVHVAVPADDVGPLMEDLVAFTGRADVDPVTSAAVAHAQFETIHPFADGNGRIGRVLIGWMLRQRLAVAYPPPVSLQMARDVGGYQAGLTLYRQDQVEPWVAWFAQVVVAAATTSADVLAQVADVQAEWREAVRDLRVDAAARRLCELLPAHPVVSALTAAESLGVSRQAAAMAIAALEHRGILVTLEGPAPGRNVRERWWAARQMLDLLGTR
ncbi:MAG: Fic family protein, partial [Acidimicrobiaceae bacterium]|nr:Fic family protein [Acidimicrobiaceae bacterium]